MKRREECQHSWQPTASPEYVKCRVCNQISKISAKAPEKRPTMVTPDQIRHLEQTLDNVLTGVAQMIIQNDCNTDTESRLESIGSTIQQAIVLSQNLRKEISNHVVAKD